MIAGTTPPGGAAVGWRIFSAEAQANQIVAKTDEFVAVDGACGITFVEYKERFAQGNQQFPDFGFVCVARRADPVQLVNHSILVEQPTLKLELALQVGEVVFFRRMLGIVKAQGQWSRNQNFVALLYAMGEINFTVCFGKLGIHASFQIFGKA